MDDIARAARVHRSTVSLALRSNPKIPAATRDRILRLAESLGYRPDPLLDAFNAHRQHSAPQRGGTTFAFVSDLPSRRALDASDLHREMLAGAQDRAAALGSSIDVFFVGPEQLSDTRLDGVLKSRSIAGVLVAAFSRRTAALRLSWPHYPAIAIESLHLAPALDCITLDYAAAARAAVRRLRAEGHRRIGFVTLAEEDLRLEHHALSGYLFECGAQGVPALPPLSLGDGTSGSLADWQRRTRPTALIAGCQTTALAVAAGTLRPGPRLPWTPVIEPRLARSMYRELGAQGVDYVHLRRQFSRCGVPERRTTIILPAQAA